MPSIFSFWPNWKEKQRSFLERVCIDLFSQLSLIYGGWVFVYKLKGWEFESCCCHCKSIHHLLSTLLVEIGNILEAFCHLGQTELEIKTFFRRYKGGCIVRLPPRALACYNKWKKYPFCAIWNNPTPPLLFIRPPYK